MHPDHTRSPGVCAHASVISGLSSQWNWLLASYFDPVTCCFLCAVTQTKMISGGSPTAGLEEEIAEWAIVTKTGGGETQHYKCTIRSRRREIKKKGGEQKRSKVDDEKEGARLSWSAARRLCGPCVPAWRKQARQGKGKRTHTHSQFWCTRRNMQQFPKLRYLLNTKTHYRHARVILCDT